MPVIFPPEGSDEAIEWAARHIEEKSPFYTSVVMPERTKGERDDSKRRQRAREDIALAARIMQETRRKCADELRGFLNRPEMAAIEVLAMLAALPGEPKLMRHTMHLKDAWPLAFGGKAWVRIECILVCTDNTIPPHADYRIVITDRGLKALAEHEAAKVRTAA
jgi:hypothetical protein